MSKASICGACKSNIKDGAKRCPECGSLQGRAFYIKVWSVYLGFFLSTISLVTLGVESAIELFSDDISEITAYNTNSEENIFNFTVSNSGSAPAVLYALSLTIPEAETCESPIVERSWSAEIENKAIEPGKTYSLSAKTPIENLYLINNFNPEVFKNPKLAKELDDFKVCRADLTYMDADGVDKVESFRFRCMPTGQCLKSILEEYSNKI